MTIVAKSGRHVSQDVMLPIWSDHQVYMWQQGQTSTVCSCKLDLYIWICWGYSILTLFPKFKTNNCLMLRSRDALFGHQYYWEQHIGPFLAKIPIFILLLLLVAFPIGLLVLFCYCCFRNLKYWPVQSLILVLFCYCTFLYLLLKWSNQWVI